MTIKCKAVVAAVSVENGLECYSIYDKSLDRWKYLEFLKKLKSVANDKIVIIVDNCRVHHAKVVQEYCKGQDVMLH